MIRKFLAIVFILMFSVVSCAYAEIDLSGYSEAELRNLIQQARSELTKFNSPAEKGTVIYENEYVKITYSEMRIEKESLKIYCILENKSSHNIIVRMDRTTCNGWDILDGTLLVSDSSKIRYYFGFSDFVELTEIESVEEIEEIRCTINILDTDTCEWLYKSEGYFYLDMPITVK